MDLSRLPPHHKVLITGTGRAGTSFTMQVLTALGMPTGFHSPGQAFFTDRMCGQETEIPTDTPLDRMGDYPRIVKDPKLTHTLAHFLDAGTLEPAHVYVLVRDVREAARSRVDRAMHWDPVTNQERPTFAGLHPDEQIRVQTERLYTGLGMLFETLALYEVPFTTVLFPRLVLDVAYFAESFRRLLRGVERADVVRAHALLADQRAIHYGAE